MGEWRYSSKILTLALQGGEWSASYPSYFNPRERAPRADLDAGKKRNISCPCQEYQNTTFQELDMLLSSGAVPTKIHQKLLMLLIFP
jgi:hypothetical protein